MSDNINFDYKNLSPFKWFVLENFPFIEADFDALTEWQLFCKIGKEMNKIINSENTLGTQMENVTNAFINLQNYIIYYFDNLDVQEEINTKLNEMVEDGTFTDLLGTYINSLKANTNLDKKMGCSSNFEFTSDNGIKDLNNIKKYFDKLIQIVWVSYNSDTGEFYAKENNINEQITNINNWINNGGNYAGIKFHQTGFNLTDLFIQYDSNTIMAKYKQFIENFIENLPYKNVINKLWILNEAPQSSLTTKYEDDIVSVIEYFKSLGYYVSTPFYIWSFINCSDKIKQSQSFYSLNIYPLYDLYGENSSINDVAERFNNDYNLISRYLNKDLYITEFGCSASWTSFSDPSRYVNEQNGKPISLLLEGFFQSDFINNSKEIYYWYYQDAINYAPYSLLSIKNNSEVRYNG